MTFSEFIVRALCFGFYDLFPTGIVRAILATDPDNTGLCAAVVGIGFALCILVSYLLGSINTALVISKFFFHDDVREHGSGNAGATNVLRTYGKKAGIFTLLGDMLKGIISILFACLLFGHPQSEYAYLYLFTAAYLSGFFCIFGHVFPIFSRFKGGKGVATAAGIVLLLNPVLFLCLFVLFAAMLAASHFVSLSSVVAVLFYPLMLSIVDRAFMPVPRGLPVLISVMIGVLVAWAHRANLKRIYNGEERKFYFRKFPPVVSSPSASQKRYEPEEDEAEITESEE